MTMEATPTAETLMQEYTDQGLTKLIAMARAQEAKQNNERRAVAEERFMLFWNNVFKDEAGLTDVQDENFGILLFGAVADYTNNGQRKLIDVPVASAIGNSQRDSLDALQQFDAYIWGKGVSSAAPSIGRTVLAEASESLMMALELQAMKINDEPTNHSSGIERQGE